MPIVMVHGLGVSGTYMLPTGGARPRSFRLCSRPSTATAKAIGPRDFWTYPVRLTRWRPGWRRSGPRRAVYIANSTRLSDGGGFRGAPSRIHRERSPHRLDGRPVGGRARRFPARGAFDLLAEPLSIHPILAHDFFRAGICRLARMLHESTNDLYAEKLLCMPVPTLVHVRSRDPIANATCGSSGCGTAARRQSQGNPRLRTRRMTRLREKWLGPFGSFIARERS